MSETLLPGDNAQERCRKSRDRIKQLEHELKAERVLRDAAIVERYEARAKVDEIADDAGVTRSRVLRIVSEH